MTNREWLLNKMQNMSDEEFAEMISNGIDIDLIITCNPHCDYSSECEDCTIKWLKAEHKEKITLSEAERVILENLSKIFKWIVRDGDLNLYVYTTKPIKSERCPGWDLKIDDVGYEMVEKLYFFNHLFRFIKWEDSEPYNIEELLKEKKTY